MTTALQVPPEAWREYFEELTGALGTVEATVEVVGRDVGDQVEHERLMLTEITYDDESDAIVVGLEAPGPPAERIEHRIERPQRVFVATDQPPPLEVVYDIQDGKQYQWLIRVERPPALPGE